MRLPLPRYIRILLARRGRGSGEGSPSARLPVLVAKGVLLGVIVWLCHWWFAIHTNLLIGSPGRALREATILVKAGDTVDVGRRDLGQKAGALSAEERHFTLTYDTDGVWIRNVAQTRRLSLEYAGLEIFAERFEILAGHTSRVFVGDDAVLTFLGVTKDGFNVEVKVRDKAEIRRFSYAHGGGKRELAKAGNVSWDDRCVELTGWRRWVGAFRDAMIAISGDLLRPRGETDIAALGGEYDCSEPTRKQIGGLGSLEWRSLKIVSREVETQVGEKKFRVPRFFIAPYDSSRRHQTVAFASWPGGGDEPTTARRYAGFADLPWRVDDKGPYGGLLGLVAGRTIYSVATEQLRNTVNVKLRPTRAVWLFSPDDCKSEQARETCPYPLNTLQPASCTEASNCWEWLPGVNQLASRSGSHAVTGSSPALGSHELQARLAAAALAVGLAAMLSGGPLLAARRFWAWWDRQGEVSPHRSLIPVMFTLASTGLSLAPEISALLGTPLTPRMALASTLVNWIFAGAMLLRGPSGILLGLMWIAVTILAALGATNLAAMAVDGDNTRWTLYFIKHKYLFLDLVPPFVVAVATCPPSALRHDLQSFVGGDSLWSWLLRLAPALALALVFFIWLLVGNQTGLEFFQPVEIGKLAFVFLTATVLMLFDGRVRARPLSQTVATTVISLSALALLAAVVAGVPGLRSDWSPIVIMAGLAAGLLLAFGGLIWARAIQETSDRHVARQSLPQAFKPGLRPRWYIRTTSWIVLPILALVLFLGWTLFGTPVGSSITFLTGTGGWPSKPTERLLKLESPGLGAGRRLVVERFITWVDLGYDRPLLTDCNFTGTPLPTSSPSTQKQPARVSPPPELAIRSCYRDIEHQVIRSRHGIAMGPCGFSKRLDDGAGSFTSTVETLAGVLAGIAAPITYFFSAQQICGAPPPASSGVNPDKDGMDLHPIRIPVVEKDFAPAYLIGVFGTGAAFLFYSAQAMLIGVVIFAFVRISRTRSGGLADEAVRRFVAIVLAGAALLFFLQWSLSWSNVLGLLPVMGQPMTWLAYATSHHLFLALPCILVFVVGLRYTGMVPYRFTPREVPRPERGRWGV